VTEAEWLDSTYPASTFEAEWGWPSPRKQRLFAVACCRRIQHLLPQWPAWQQAPAVAERFADRQAKRVDLKAAVAALPKVRSDTARRGCTYADLLAEFAAGALRWACEPSLRSYASQCANNAAVAAAYAALPLEEPYVPPGHSPHKRRFWDAENAEQAEQIALLCDVCGHPFRPAVARTGPLAPEVIRLARAAYQERPLPSGSLDATRLAVLADALEESGCTEGSLLGHLRGPGPHVRGCWALDLLLGKA
jgi:hypothetical protein